MEAIQLQKNSCSDFWGNIVLSKEGILCAFIGICLFLCTFISFNPVIGAISLFLIALFMVVLLQKYTIMYLKYLHYIFAVIANLAGCAAVEFSEFYLFELRTTSSYVGALPLIAFNWWLFFVVLLLHDSWMINRQERQHNRTINVVDYFSKDNKNNILAYIAACIGCLFIVYMFLVVFKNPSFALGIDRFQYAKEFDYGALYYQASRGMKYLLIPIIVVAIYKKSKIGWFALAVFCLYSFWVGNKFGAFFSLVCLMAMIYSQDIIQKGEKYKKDVMIIMVVVVVLIGVAVFGVSFTRTDGTASYFAPRLSQQGQLWWRTYDITNKWHIDEFGDEISAAINATPEIADNVGAKNGIYKVMYNTAPREVVNNKLNSGSAYTEAGFAAAYYYMGMPGCFLFALICAILSSFFVNSFLYHLRYNQFIRAFIHYRFYSNIHIFVSAFTMFPFFSKTSILSYIILIVCYKKIFKLESIQI